MYQPIIEGSDEIDPFDYFHTSDSDQSFRSRNYPRPNLQLFPCVPVVRVIYRPQTGYLYTLIHPYPFARYYSYQWFLKNFQQTKYDLPAYFMERRMFNKNRRK